MTTPQTHQELESHLKEQLDFLQSSCDSYDSGNHAEGKRIAATLRLLLHDTNSSKSLTNQLGLKDQSFLSTCSELSVDPMVKTSETGLINVFLGDDSPTFYVPLDAASDKKDLTFEDWWNEVIIIDPEENKFFRKDIVLAIANQDGGAHVDPTLKSEYASLSRKNSLGRMMQKDGKWQALETPELATVRQIGHEVLKTLIKDYSKQPISRGDGYVIGDVHLQFGTSNSSRQHQKIGRNDPCFCGSKIKFKKCCGRT